MRQTFCCAWTLAVVHTEIGLSAPSNSVPASFLAHCAHGYPQHETGRNPCRRHPQPLLDAHHWGSLIHMHMLPLFSPSQRTLQGCHPLCHPAIGGLKRTPMSSCPSSQINSCCNSMGQMSVVSNHTSIACNPILRSCPAPYLLPRGPRR